MPATFSSPGRRHACTTRAAAALRTPRAAARNSGRRRSRTRSGPEGACAEGSGREALAATRPARSDDLAAADGCHARTETVPPFAHEAAWLIGTLHGSNLDWGTKRLAGI